MACSCTKHPAPAGSPGGISAVRYCGIGVIALRAWTAIYWNIEEFSRWIAYGLLGLPQGSPLCRTAAT